MKIRISIIAGLLIASSACTAMWLLGRQQAVPEISGVWIENPNLIEEFELTDHRNKVFTNKDLQVRWSLVAYGYTHCPDYCPVILSTLSNVEKELSSGGEFLDLNWLFYSVDHQRDNVEQLAKYLSYFDTPYVGLTVVPGQVFKSFEAGLGIYYEKDLSSEVKHHNHNGYIVNHSLMLLLINPKGEFKAVLRPQKQPDGRYAFNADQILEDYLAIRRFTRG